MEQHDHALLSGPGVISGQAGNVVAALDHHRASSIDFCPLHGHSHRLANQPRARQSAPIPKQCAGMVTDHQRLTICLHGARLNFVQIRRQQGQAMGGVSQQIPLQQHLSDTIGPQLGQARRLQQGLSKLFQLNRVIGHGGLTSFANGWVRTIPLPAAVTSPLRHSQSQQGTACADGPDGLHAPLANANQFIIKINGRIAMSRHQPQPVAQ